MTNLKKRIKELEKKLEYEKNKSIENFLKWQRLKAGNVEALRLKNIEIKRLKNEVKLRDLFGAELVKLTKELKTTCEELKSANESLCKTINDDTQIQKSLTAQVQMLEEGLRKINAEEINSQRPGGGYTRSATLSYETLTKLEQMRKGKV